MRASCCPGLGLVLVLVLGLAAAIALPDARADRLAPRPQQVTVAHRDMGRAPVLGPGHAPVTVDFFLNLSTRRRHVVRLHKALQALSERHPRRLRVVYRPVATPGNSRLAEAAMEAFVQGRFFAFMDELLVFGNRRGHTVPRSEAEYRALCERTGVSYQRVEAAWADGRHLASLGAHRRYIRRRSVQRLPIPILLFNGVVHRIHGSGGDLDTLETVYDDAYDQARRALGQGVALEDLYELSLHDLWGTQEPVTIRAGSIEGPDGTGLPYSGDLEDIPLSGPHPGGHAIGPADAPVTVRVYCNFVSKLCRFLHNELDRVLALYPDEVRLVFHPMFPADSLHADDIVRVQWAGQCAAAQGAFWAFSSNAYRQLPSWYRRSPHDSVEAFIAAVARDVDLDRDPFEACMADPEVRRAVEAEIRAGRRAGITQSPSLVIGGRIYAGSKSEIELRSLIEQELAPGLLERLAPALDRGPGALLQLGRGKAP